MEDLGLPILTLQLLACDFEQVFKISLSLIFLKCRLRSYYILHRVVIRVVNGIIDQKTIYKLKEIRKIHPKREGYKN